MRILTIAFQGAAVAIGIGIISMVGHKAASDYCQLTPAYNPFDPIAKQIDDNRQHTRLCNTVETLEPFNFLYFPPA